MDEIEDLAFSFAIEYLLFGDKRLIAKNDDDTEWITVKGNHIPIKEGQSKAEAVKEFLAKKEKQSKTNTSKPIAGIKRGKPMSFKQANGGKVNPKYTGKNDGYSNNCQTCVLTFELRLRGYDIEAVPFNENNPAMKQLAQKPWLAYKDKRTGETPKILSSPSQNYKECEKWLKQNIKKGERYCFGYRVGLNYSKHVVEVQKDILGQINFYDPQSGEQLETNNVLYDAHACLRVGAKKYHFPPIIFRIDDKDFNIDLINNIFKQN